MGQACSKLVLLIQRSVIRELRNYPGGAFVSGLSQTKRKQTPFNENRRLITYTHEFKDYGIWVELVYSNQEIFKR